ncbi:GDSL-type esterase/lipase family protein [Trichocoleus sp. FACHB-262]|uniref:GDSL-type esterase/lipase family protein n=1 Tax=Trichocoleus sp. FACHB-262 TaxID=2692869 RepID=UPI0016899940|nr:GDSL-type esterase/lipase family protein [Trichocoleus sp. FACHB-262]MBD2119885.1 G-D-S-L family lipolytic protein [Trichocoleus sp. FACHB-262]
MIEWLVSSVCTISILINILFSLSGIYLLTKRGSLHCAIKKLSQGIKLNFFLHKEPRNSVVYPPRYFHQKSIFSILTLSKNKIIFLGDSHIDNCGWSELFNNTNLINRGLGGDTTDGVLQRLDEVLESYPRQIFLMVGINDLNAARTVEQVEFYYKEILSRIQIKSPRTQVFIQSVLPVNKDFDHKAFKANNKTIRVLNSKLQILAKDFSFQYVDLFSHFINSHQKLYACYTFDGIHLNGKGYIVWKQLIEKCIAE